MNPKFYDLPEEKRARIINGGFRVFAQNTYKKSPMSEIAGDAGISKALLFHYFQNKRELYLFLWDAACRLTIEYLDKYGCYEPTGLFEMMERGMRAKLEMMRKYPDMTNFVIKAFYEKEPSICREIQRSYWAYFGVKADRALVEVDPEQFIPGLDLQMMYREMYWASEGYLWEMLQRGEVDIDRLEQDFARLMAFWKSVYCKKADGEDGRNECH